MKDKKRKVAARIAVLWQIDYALHERKYLEALSLVHEELAAYGIARPDCYCYRPRRHDEHDANCKSIRGLLTIPAVAHG